MAKKNKSNNIKTNEHYQPINQKVIRKIKKNQTPDKSFD